MKAWDGETDPFALMTSDHSCSNEVCVADVGAPYASVYVPGNGGGGRRLATPCYR